MEFEIEKRKDGRWRLEFKENRKMRDGDWSLKLKKKRWEMEIGVEKKDERWRLEFEIKKKKMGVGDWSLKER